MKISTVLLRWYKSFNLNYMNYTDRRTGVVDRPWHRLGRQDDDTTAFPFIEIPLEDDITTIVGANESGKSHLLGAISQVLTGKGIPDANGNTTDYARTDLCHYTSPRSKNAEDWPHIGLQFVGLSQVDINNLSDACGEKEGASKIVPAGCVLTLILAPDNHGTVAHLYFNNDAPILLTSPQLDAVRLCLPRVEFIKSDLAISDQVPVDTLLAAYGDAGSGLSFEFSALQKIASDIFAMSLPEKGAAPDNLGTKLTSWKNSLNSAKIGESTKAELEALLFKDVMGITADTLRFVRDLKIGNRTHADSLTAKWNKEIEERLNLSHYWQQDDSFALGISYKQGIIFFDISDKTGATYTFRERSSGLRFFLSYYIQAKALEMSSRGSNAIVLMDEPDSFLSIMGQRNLLAVFESLVGAESSGQSCQLVYTTHSPFLINRNYPRRLRLVRKGDAEEGTQIIDSAMLRRYEPVRSALGIDCAQTLFMGATNVVVEGPTDQFLLAELVRCFISPSNVTELLDLNALVLVSAESAPGVEKLLAASQWGDEPVPATVVLLDSDSEGDLAKKKITGKHRNSKRLIHEEYVLQIADTIGGGSPEHAILTTEDVLPTELYGQALLSYIERWYPDKYKDNLDALSDAVKVPEFMKAGLAVGAGEIMNRLVHDSPKTYDKMGVLQEAVRLIFEEHPVALQNQEQLQERLFQFCHTIRRAVAASQQAARRASGKQSIQRIIDDYFKTHKESSSVFDILLLLERLQRDTRLLGADGEKLDNSLTRLLAEIDKARSANQHLYKGHAWERWKAAIQTIRKNPLEAQIEIGTDGPELELHADAKASVEPKQIEMKAESVPTGKAAE